MLDREMPDRFFFVLSRDYSKHLESEVRKMLKED